MEEKGTKRVLIISEFFFPEEFKINDLAFLWKSKGYEVEVLTQIPTYPKGEVFPEYKNKSYYKEEKNGVIIHRLKAVEGYKSSVYKKILKYFSFMIKGAIWARKNGGRFDYVFGFNQASLTAMIPGVVIKKKYRKPFTIWVQDIWPDSVYAYGYKEKGLLVYFLNLFVKYVYRNVDHFAISCHGFRDKLLRYIEPGKEIIYAPNWSEELNLDGHDFSFSEDKKLHITFAGNMGKVQNLPNIVEAFLSLSEEIKNEMQLNFIGDGTIREELEEMCGESVNKNVFFWGRQPTSEMSKYYNATDFLIISLIDQPIFGITVPSKFQTCVAAKKPILAIINGDVANLVNEYSLGLTSSPSNVEEIRLMFEKCYHLNNQEKKAMISSNERLLSDVFNREKIVSDLETLTFQDNKQ